MNYRKRSSLEVLNVSNKKQKKVLGDVNQNIDIPKVAEKKKLEIYENGKSDSENMSGIIEKVFVRNFMCHKSLEINFNKNINFVIGRNGSGKSAILTALVVGLGGRAADTNRGKSLKNFIKTGQTISSIEIIIRNMGVDAYKGEIYGDRILIERQITLKTASYKIKSATGRIISNSAKEVGKICDALNVQVDNPICVLNQDTSRNFLNSSDPKRKYILFMRATNLENINDYYKVISKDRHEIEEKLRNKQQAFNQLKNQMKHWENKLKLIESLDSLQNDLEYLERELYWSKNRIMHNELDEIKANIQKLNEQFEQEDEKSKHFNEDDQHTTNNINDINQKLEEIGTELRKIEAKYADIRGKNRLLEDAYNKKQIEVRDKKYITEKKVNRCESFNNQVKQIIDRVESISEKRATQKREIERITAHLNELQAQLTTSEVEMDHRRGSIRNVQDTEKKYMQDISEFNSLLAQKNAQIKNLSNQTNILSLYGANMAACVKEIERNKHKFTELPRGPLGRYIKLKDKKWTAAVELFIKHGMLKVFCVTNSQDYKTLDNIFSQYFQKGSKPLIICSKFYHKVFDVSRKRVQCPAGYYSLQDVLEISDPVIENCLIDQIRMETVLLIPNDEDAIRLMSHEENVPPNCSKSITLKGDLYYPDPDYRSYATKFKTATLLQSSTADAIRQFENDIQDIQQKKNELENKIRINRQNISSQQISLKEHETHLTNLRQDRIKLQNQKRQLEYQMDPEDQNTDTLISELESMKKEVEEAKRQESQCEVECEKLKENINENKTALKNVQTTIDSLRSRMEPLQMQKMTEEAKLAEFVANCDTFKKKKSEIKKNIQHQKGLEKEIIKKIAEHLKSKEGDEISNPRNEREIEHLRKSIETSIRSINLQTDDPAYVKEMFNKSCEKYEGCKDMMRKLLESLDLIIVSIDKRIQDYRKLIRRIGSTVEKMFHNVLRLRQYQGHLEINHEKRELEIHVQTQNNTTNDGDTRTLSGGERSYATVAFIMALWRSVKFPFYFMDEFDVFMDKINRKIIMDLLLQHADENLDCQFVFLTPQDISSIKSKPQLTIHRMADPERDVN